MNVGSPMSSLTTSGAGGAPAPFASAATVSGASAVFTVAMVSLRFSSSSLPLRAVGPSGGGISHSMSMRSCLSSDIGAVRLPRVRLVRKRYVGFAAAVVIPGGEIVTNTHLNWPGGLLFECGEGLLQEIE